MKKNCTHNTQYSFSIINWTRTLLNLHWEVIFFSSLFVNVYAMSDTHTYIQAWREREYSKICQSWKKNNVTHTLSKCLTLLRSLSFSLDECEHIRVSRLIPLTYTHINARVWCMCMCALERETATSRKKSKMWV